MEADVILLGLQGEYNLLRSSFHPFADDFKCVVNIVKLREPCRALYKWFCVSLCHLVLTLVLFWLQEVADEDPFLSTGDKQMFISYLSFGKKSARAGWSQLDTIAACRTACTLNHPVKFIELAVEMWAENRETYEEAAVQAAYDSMVHQDTVTSESLFITQESPQGEHMITLAPGRVFAYL